jgi:pimeloyl-ACP methyl ester carboxylesterase
VKALLNGIHQHYEMHGQGLPVIFIHGFPLSRRIWQPQVQALHDEFCVITPDLRGHGESEAPPGVYSMEKFADDLCALLDHLRRGPAVIIGHSMGGYIAFACLRKYPDRAKGLVLVSTRAGADSPEGKTGRETLAQAVEKENSAAPVVAKMLPNMMAQTSIAAAPHLRAEVERMMANTSLNGLTGALRGMAARTDAGDLLTSLRLPALIMAGTADALIPHTESEQMARTIPGAQLHLIEGAGHLPSLEKPEEMNRVLKAWLQKFFNTETRSA